MKEFLKARITRWYGNALIDYDIHGHFIDAIADGNKLEIKWEEDGTRYHMTFQYANTFTPEEIYNIWMAGDWEEEVA